MTAHIKGVAVDSRRFGAPPDLVVAFQALQALQAFHAADENPTDLGPLVVGALHGCFGLLARLEEPDNRIEVLRVVMVLLRSFSKIREDPSMQRVRAIVVGYLQAFWYGLLGSPPPQQAQAQAPGSGDANTGNARGMCMPCGPAGSMATEDLRGLPLAFGFCQAIAAPGRRA